MKIWILGSTQAGFISWSVSGNNSYCFWKPESCHFHENFTWISWSNKALISVQGSCFLPDQKSSFAPTFYSSCSKTVDMSVATRFCEGNGIILKMQPFPGSLGRYFEVEWLSDFEPERERLFQQVTCGWCVIKKVMISRPCWCCRLVIQIELPSSEDMRRSVVLGKVRIHLTTEQLPS